MGYGRYVKYSVPDFFLCMLMSVGMTINVYQGFNLPQALSKSVGQLTVISAVLLVILFVAAYSRKTVKFAVPSAVILIVIAVSIAYINNIALTETSDSEQNGGLWYLLTFFCVTVIFLLARTWWGSLMLVAGGTFILCASAVLEYECMAWGFIMFMFAGGVNFMYKRYRKGILNFSSVKDAFPQLLGAASLVMTLSLVIGSLICFTVVKAIDPPTKSIELITKIVSIQVLDVLGISQTESLMDENNTSDNVNENFNKLTNQTGTQDEELEQDAENMSSEGSNVDESSTSESDTVLNPDESVYARAVSYSRTVTTLKLMLLLVILILFAVLVWFIINRRKLMLKRISTRTKEDQIIFFYHWYCAKFKHLGIAPIGSDTPYEYAKRISIKTERLDTSNVTWKELTESFVNVCYGHTEVSDESFEKWTEFFKEFPRKCKKIMGKKYIFLQFFI